MSIISLFSHLTHNDRDICPSFMVVCYLWPQVPENSWESPGSSHLQGASWQLFFWIKHLSNEQYGGCVWVHIMKVGFYLRHLEGHLLAIRLEDVCQQTQRPLPGNHVLLLHLCPQHLCLLPAVCLLWKKTTITMRKKVSCRVIYSTNDCTVGQGVLVITPHIHTHSTRE